jgi:hypothetical protein
MYFARIHPLSFDLALMMCLQNSQGKENRLKVVVMFVNFSLRNLEARTEISLLTPGNLLLSCSL